MQQAHIRRNKKKSENVYGKVRIRSCSVLGEGTHVTSATTRSMYEAYLFVQRDCAAYGEKRSETARYHGAMEARRPEAGDNTTLTMCVVCAVFTLHRRSFYPTAVHPVPVLIRHHAEITILVRMV